MSRLKLSIVLTLALLLGLGSGLAQAQEAVPVLISEGPPSIGTAVIWDDLALSDAITFTLADVPAPAAGTAYEGWLISDDGSIKLSTGILAVATDGTVNHDFTSPDGENFVHLYDKVVITIEPVPDSDPGPSPDVAYSHAIPAGAITHIRHLLTNWPPGESKGILTNLKEQLDTAILHANLAKREADAGNVAGLRQHIEHVINIIEGEDGPNFGDLDGNGSTQNPGDGVGVLTHAANRKHGPFAAAAAPDDPVVVTEAEHVDAAGANAESRATSARDIALSSVLNADLVLAKIFLGPGSRTVISQLETARNGFLHFDGIPVEDGAEQAYLHGQEMATYTLVAGPPPATEVEATAGPRPGLGLPSVGDPTVRLLAPMALVASLLFLGFGGALLVRGRRGRSIS